MSLHGHTEIMRWGEAHRAVFAQKLLHNHLQSGKKFVSSGDGAWIMQKMREDDERRMPNSF
jgi:hypothetical protein